MKKVIFLLLVVSAFGFSQAPNNQGIRKWYLVGSTAQGDTFSALSPARNTSAAILGNYSRVTARLKTNDSTHAYISIDQNLSGTWSPLDSVLIHPASGAAADTFWNLRNSVAELLDASGAQHRFRLNFQAGCASQNQATKPRVTLWLELFD